MSEALTITAEFPAEAQRILARLKEMPMRVLVAAVNATDREMELTLGYVKANKLSQRGPTTLGVVTNQLRGSAYRTPARLQGNTITASIGTPVRYAGVHEFGYSGSMTVKEHTRQTAERFAIDNGRRTVSRSQAERLGLLTKRGKGRKGMADEVAGKEVTVRQHMRQVNFPARAMFRTGITERLGDMANAIGEAVVKEALNG